MKKSLILSVTLNFLLILFAVYLFTRDEVKKQQPSEPIQAVKSPQPAQPKTGTQSFSAQWNHKKSLFEVLPDDPGEIIFLGNSITDGCEWAELFRNPLIKNRGIGGDVTQGILLRLSEVTESRPKKIFIMIGINDLSRKISVNEIVKNYTEIIDRIHSESPATKIYIQSTLPVNEPSVIKNDSVMALNTKLKSLSEAKRLTFVNLFDSFKDDNNALNKKFTNDGVHLKGEGYLLWKELIKAYVN